MVTGSAMYSIEANKKNFILTPFNKALLVNRQIVSNYESWFHDPVVTNYNSHGLFPYTAAKRESFFDSLDTSDNTIVLAIMGLLDAGKYQHIGNVSLQGINWIYRSAELAVIIGETDYHGQGIGTAACKKIIDHGFSKLNLNRIWTGTAETNIGMRNTAVKCNMLQEGVFRQGMFLHGKYTDICCYSILKTEWEKRND